MRKIADATNRVIGFWLAAWPVYLCATWALIGSVTAAFDTWIQVAFILLLAAALGLGWKNLNRLAKVGGVLLVVAGLAAYSAYLLEINNPMSSTIGKAGTPLAPLRVVELVALFLFIAAFFTLQFGLIRASKTRSTWLLFAALYSAAIWAWTNYTGTKLLDGTVQRLFDLAILQALFTVSTLLIGLILVIDLVVSKSIRKRHNA
jgi:hypothetical protein